MSRYRSEEDVLRARIEELQAQLSEARARRIDVERSLNLGPEAPGLFSRSMFWLGKTLRRAFSWDKPPPSASLEELRRRADRLEQSLFETEESTRSLEQEVRRREARKPRS